MVGQDDGTSVAVTTMPSTLAAPGLANNTVATIGTPPIAVPSQVHQGAWAKPAWSGTARG